MQTSISKLLNPRSKRNIDNDYKIIFGSFDNNFKGLIQDPRANGFRLFFSEDEKNEGKNRLHIFYIIIKLKRVIITYLHVQYPAVLPRKQ